MTNEQFLQQFGHFIDAPNGTLKLREMVLQLAVQGKLVEQDAGDKPALELLEQIKTEKAKLAAEGVIKIAKEYPAVRENEIPYAIPNSWKWVRINEIGHNWGQKAPDSDFTYIDVSAINKEVGVIQEPNILSAKEAPSRARKIVKNGTVIYSTVRPYLLNIAVIDNEYDPEPIASTAFAVIHPYCGMSVRYIYSYLRSPAFINYVESVQTGIAYPAINDKQFFNGLIPLPPLAEQHRIVTKVDKLMALCDQLEVECNAREATRQRLIRAVHQPLTEAADAKVTQTAWHRIRDNFADLYTTLEAVQALRQTILNLAVQGRLVPHEQSEGTGEELLTKILCLVGNKKKMKRAGYEFIDNEDYQISIPSSWTQSTLDNISIFTNGKAHEQYVDENGEYVLINSKFVSNSGRIRKHTSHRLTPLNKGDIAIVMSDVPSGRALARCYLVTESDKYTLNQRIGGINLPLMYDKFIFYVLDRNPFYLRFDDGKKQTNLRKNQILSCPIPIPPLAEQHRIVAKVDELMVLCDQLEINIRNKNDNATRYAEAVVAQVIA